MEKVLVTGATGFIGLHCIAQLGRATASPAQCARQAALKRSSKPFLSSNYPPRICLLSKPISKDEGWDEAVAGCDYVLHVASPFIVGVPKHEDELYPRR